MWDFVCCVTARLSFFFLSWPKLCSVPLFQRVGRGNVPLLLRSWWAPVTLEHPATPASSPNSQVRQMHICDFRFSFFFLTCCFYTNRLHCYLFFSLKYFLWVWKFKVKTPRSFWPRRREADNVVSPVTPEARVSHAGGSGDRNKTMRGSREMCWVQL